MKAQSLAVVGQISLFRNVFNRGLLSDTHSRIGNTLSGKYLLALITAITLIFSSDTSLAQTAGDYRTVAGGTWSTVANWERFNGGTWVAPGANGYPGQTTGTGTVTIRNGHAMTLDVSPGNVIGALSVTNGSVVFGNSATARTLSVSGNVDISASQSISTSATSAAHVLSIGGTITNNGTFNFANPSGAATVRITGGATSISGGGTFTFGNFTLNTSSGSNVTVNATSNISVSGTLDFSASGNRLLIIGNNSNLVLGAAATISNFGSTRYIQLNGTSSTNSQLIKGNTGSEAQWEIIYPVGTASGGYTPLDLTTASGANITNNPTTGSTISIKPVYAASSIGQLRRTFRISVASNAVATTFTNGRFYYDVTADVSAGDNIANYSTIWYLNASSGTWSSIAGTAPGAGFFTASSTAQSLATGTYYFTIANATAYPATWYTYQNGSWSSTAVWTTDPSGTTSVNPLSLTPTTGDQVVILNGYSVQCDVNNMTLSTTRIEGGGTLDMSVSTGNNLGVVSGQGLLRVNGVGLPTANYTAFVTAGTGGTIEYYDTGGTLPVGQTTYNNLKLTSSGPAATFITANATTTTIAGNLDITQTAGTGPVTWQVNDNSATQRNVTILGDLTVSANARIRAGSGNPGTRHSLLLYGDLTNNGSIKFFDDSFATLSDANYTAGNVYTSALTGRAINVTFAGVATQTVQCNNQTDFYRLIVDKGTGRQAMVTVNSSATSNFRLFGPTNLANSGTSPNLVSNNALSLVNGTLQLTGTINIPNLCTNGTAAAGVDYLSIPQRAGLWINGAGVSVTVANNLTTNDDQRILIDGLVRISAGTVSGGYSRGFGAGNAGGVFIMEGGTLNVWQFRPLFGSSDIFSFIQSGGTINIGTTGYNGTPSLAGVTDTFANGYGRFSLPEPTCSFEMSGGVINIGSPTTLAGAGGWEVQSAAGNYNVTGGTINCYITTGGNTFGISSTAPLYNLNVYKTGTGTLTATVSQSLTVLNDVTLVSGNTPTLSSSGATLTIGRNFTVNSATTFTPGTRLTFNGAGAQVWTNDGTIGTMATTEVVVNKASGVLSLAGANAFPNTGSIGTLTLTSGTLNDGGKDITVTVGISNSATHTGTGSIIVSGPTAIGGADGKFGNLTVTTGAAVSTAGKQTVNGNLRLTAANTSLNIGSNNLTVIGGIFSNLITAVSFSATKRIITNGLHNDGGLTRQATSGADLLFPVGTSATASSYTPATIRVAAATAGKITIKPVAGTHPNVTTTLQSVQYYWRVSSEDFVGISAVLHRTYTYQDATRNAASANYRPARYDGTTFTWGYSPTTYDATTGGGTTAIPDFSTGGWIGIPTAQPQLDGDYTAGNLTAFQSVTVYYSRASGNWGTTSTWSNVSVGGAAAASTPCATCPVVIGDGGANNHTVTINANNQGGGSLFLAAGSTLDCGTAFTGLNFGVNTSGTGRLRIGSANFPAGDFLSFLGPSGGTVEWYGATKTIPTNGPAPMNLSLATYCYLIISPSTGQTISMPASNLTVYKDFTINGTGTGQVETNTTLARTLILNGNVNVDAGTFQLNSNTAATSTTLNIQGNTTIASGASLLVQNAGTGNHTLTTNGSIINNGTVNFRRTAARYLNLIFTGIAPASFTGTNAGASTTLNVLTVNKGTSQTPTLTFDVAGTLDTQTNNWLTLTSGTFIHARTGGSITLTNTATNPYNIPSQARLKVNSGTVNISEVADNDSDLTLAGTLEVSGGTVNINSTASANNNDIEYAAAGTPTIIVSSGTLYVNGSIRRSTVTLSGSLVYTQTGGTVTVGGRAASNTRGVFEIENYPGSSFTLTGNSILEILRSSGGTSFSDLYLIPQTSNVASTGTIRIGSNSLGAQTLTANVVPTIGNFTVMGAAGNAQTVDLVSSDLSTSGTLTINTASTLRTNSLNVNVGGDLSIVGTYNGSNNTTTFNGTGTQTGTLSGTSTFLNMTVNKASGTATLSGTSPTITNLNILSGVLDVSSIGLTVTGNVVNNSSQVGTGSITMSGASSTHTITSNGGSFTNLTLGTGSTTKTVTVVGNMSIVGTLNFATTNRFLMIGGYRLTLGTGSSVTGAGSSAFIRTNGVSSDLGVLKNWATGTATFTYPVGTLTNYTPVTFTLNVTTAGDLTVAPVNSRHPSYNFTSTEQILNYYWIVKRGATLAYNTAAPNVGPHTYAYPAGLIGGSGGALLAGYFKVANPTGWYTATADHGGVATSTLMTFTGFLDINLPGASQTYHYTIGTALTLAPSIDKVYSRFAGGNWNDLNSWTTNPLGTGPAVTPGPQGLVGVSFVILTGATITSTANTITAASTEINGTLDIGTTVAHDLGIISGTGTLRSSTNTLPAGDYTAFVSATGGTIEYVAPVTMNNRSQYNNLSITGTGSVTMTNTDITLNGNLTIASGATLTNAANNRNITLARNWTNNGTFTPGTGTVSFTGTTDQNITGATTFYGFTVNKSSGRILLNNLTTVNGLLSMTSGNIVSTTSAMLDLGTSATLSGGSANSFVDGPVRKRISSSGSFTFPTGSISASRYRPAALSNTSAFEIWTVTYFSQNPTAGGYNNQLLNTANMAKVSQYEYWTIDRAATASAQVTLTYGTGSYAPPNIGDVSSLRVAHWDGTQWDIPAGGGTVTQSGTITDGTVSITNVTDFSPFTFASTDMSSPLPIELLFFHARAESDNVVLSWATAQEINNDFFTIQKTTDLETFYDVAVVDGKGNTRTRQNYSTTDRAPFPGRSYYRLKQTDLDGQVSYSELVVVNFDGSFQPTLSVFPNPSTGSDLTIELQVAPENANTELPFVLIDQRGQQITDGTMVIDETGMARKELSFNDRLSAGLYIVRIANNPLLVRKVIVK